MMFEQQYIKKPLRIRVKKSILAYVLISGSLNELFVKRRIRKEELLLKK